MNRTKHTYLIPILVGIFALIFAVTPQPARAATIIVDNPTGDIADDGQCSLREAIVTANTDTTISSIFLFNSLDECETGSGDDVITLETDVTLTEIDNSVNGLPPITTNITIDGAGFTIQRDSNTEDEFRLFAVTNIGTLTLENTTLQNGFISGTSNGGAIFVDGGIATIRNSTLRGNEAGFGGAIRVQNNGGVAIVGSILSGNRADREGGAIFTTSGGGANIINSTIASNLAGNVTGGARNAGGTLNVVNSIVVDNFEGNARDDLNNVSAANNTAATQNITGNDNIVLETSVNIGFVNPIDASQAPTIAGDYRITTNSIVINKGDNVVTNNFSLDFDIDGNTRIQDGTVDLGANEVDRCGAVAFPTTVTNAGGLNNAIHCANANGTNDLINLGADLSVDYEDGGANAFEPITTNITIDGAGFTIDRASSTEGRFFLVEAAGSLTLRDMEISGGDMNGSGGAISNTGALSTENVIFRGNQATGLGGAIRNFAAGATTFRDTQFINSNATNGSAVSFGGIHSGGILLNNVIIHSGSANTTIHTHSDFTGTIIATNITVAGNNGIGIEVEGGNFRLYNSILWGNNGGEANFEDTANELTIRYSAIEGGIAGITGSGTPIDDGNNITLTAQDTVFVDPDNDDFHLIEGSPVIDMGDNTLASNAGLVTDFEGDTRIFNGTVDMGADEYIPDNIVPLANNDAFVVTLGQSLDVTAPGVLQNDFDADDDPLTAILETDVTQGTLNLNSDGSFTYTPNPDATGTDNFTYFAFDGTVNSAAPAEVTLNIEDPAGTPPRLYPFNEQIVTADSYLGPNFTFRHIDGVEWYQIYIGLDDYSVQAVFEWFPALATSQDATAGDEICDAVTLVCTIPQDLWLVDGSYIWWVSTWSPNDTAQDIEDSWNSTTFTVDFDEPATTLTMIQPTNGATISAAPSAIEWERDDNALWYQIWIGPADYSVMDFYFNWEDATEICDPTCTIPNDTNQLGFTDDAYEIWIEAWGPGGYTTWTDFTNTPIAFTIDSNASTAAIPRPGR